MRWVAASGKCLAFDMTKQEFAERIRIGQDYSLERGKGGDWAWRFCLELTPYFAAGLFFCPRLLAESLPFATLWPGFFCLFCGGSSLSIGGFPFPARSRIRKVSARLPRRPLSRKYSSVRKAETFSATATLMSWFRAPNLL